METTQKCGHRTITLLGSDETGLREIRCEECGIQLTRRIGDDGTYRYHELPCYDGGDTRI